MRQPRFDCSRRQFAFRLGALLAPLAVAGCTPWVDKSWPDKDVNRANPASEIDNTDRQLRLPGETMLTLLRIPAGQFLMGSPAGETGRTSEERQHRVILTQPFWLGRTEITQRQWSAVMNRTQRDQRALAQDERRSRQNVQSTLSGEGPEHPIYYVSWDEAVEFCRRINERESADRRIPPGYGYWLPTEAQWEYACRAGSDGPFGAGGMLDELAWYDATAGGAVHPVATRRPNAWGLHDMHGNVREWCADYYGEYPEGTAIDPLGPETATDRVERGGGLADPARQCRSAQRNGAPGNLRHANVGFRIALRRMGR